MRLECLLDYQAKIPTAKVRHGEVLFMCLLSSRRYTSAA